MTNIFAKIKKSVSVSVALATLMSVFVSASGASASSPQFNFLPGDRELMVGRTLSMSDYANPVSATPSDKVTVAIYYHNGVPNTTATNTRIKVNIPTDISQSQKLTATISADNAATINATVVNGQIVGHDNLTINLSDLSAVQYVPGSTLWYPDLNQHPNESGIVMPDDIIGANGLNIGSINGCWNYAGYVLFQVAFNQNATLQTDKWVTVFGGDNQWHKEVTASAGDQLKYLIYYNDSGNGTAHNVVITDTLPNHITYAANSMMKRVKDANNNDVDTSIPDSAFTVSGNTITVPLGDVLPGQNNSGYIYFKVNIDANLAIGTYALTNNETLSSSNAPSVSATALTTVTVTPTPTPDVKILKEVVNVTTGGSTWVKTNTAHPGDRLEYRLTIYNQGTAPAGNVSVKDILPNNVSFVGGSAKIYTTDPNSGQTVPDSIVGSGYTIGTVQNGVPTGNRYITFDVIVSTNLGAGTTDLINNSFVFVNGTQVDTSSATTTVTAETGLLLTKEIWNANLGVWVTHLDGVKPGDTLTYRIMVRNTGNVIVYNPVIKDNLPNLVDYVAGSTLMDGVTQVDDQWIVSNIGILIANVAPGGYKTITFDVKTQSCPPGGTYTQVNTASVTANAISLKNATAEFVITAGAPGIPGI